MLLSSILAWIMRYGAPIFLLFEGSVLLMAISNVILMPKLRKSKKRRDVRISLLVPARNEENNIERCVRGLLNQDYPNFEVIVLNDNSTDATGSILGKLAAEDSKLKLINGKPLPDGWLGMCWACHQLAKASNGEYLMFFDADTWTEPICAGATLDVFENMRADMVSGIAHHHYGGLAEIMAVSIAPWGMISVFPVVLMHYLKLGFPSIAAGMFMTFRRDKYFEIGGHEAVKMDAVLDKSLARLMKRKGMKIICVDATEALHCRMYHSMKEAFLGFAKNIFATFDFGVLRCVSVFLIMFLTFLTPALYLIVFGMKRDPALATTALILVGLSLALWTITHVKTKLPLYLVPLYPVSFTIWFLMTMTSVVHAIFGLSTWKGRKMPRPKVSII